MRTFRVRGHQKPRACAGAGHFKIFMCDREYEFSVCCFRGAAVERWYICMDTFVFLSKSWEMLSAGWAQSLQGDVRQLLLYCEFSSMLEGFIPKCCDLIVYVELGPSICPYTCGQIYMSTALDLCCLRDFSWPGFPQSSLLSMRAEFGSQRMNSVSGPLL